MSYAGISECPVDNMFFYLVSTRASHCIVASFDRIYCSILLRLEVLMDSTPCGIDGAEFLYLALKGKLEKLPPHFFRDGNRALSKAF